MTEDDPRDSGNSISNTALRAMAQLHSGLVMDRRARVLSQHIASILPRSARVLDVGAGNGELSRAIMAHRPDVKIDGLDTFLWPERFIEVRKFDGTTIPYDNESYDTCLISDVLHHIEKPLGLMSEMVRVARNSIVIKDHVADSRIDFATLKFMDWFGNRGHGVVLPYCYWTWDAWQRAFQQLGLEIETIERDLCLYPFPVSVLCDRKLHFISRLGMRGDRKD